MALFVRFAFGLVAVDGVFEVLVFAFLLFIAIDDNRIEIVSGAAGFRCAFNALAFEEAFRRC